MTDAKIGYQSTFGIGDDESPTNYTTLAEVTSISGPGISRDAVDASNMQSPNAFREKIAGFSDGGEFSLELNFVPGGTAASTLMAEFNSRDSKNYQVTWPDGSVLEFTGFCTGFEVEAPLDDKMAATATFAVSGRPTLIQA